MLNQQCPWADRIHSQYYSGSMSFEFVLILEGKRGGTSIKEIICLLIPGHSREADGYRRPLPRLEHMCVYDICPVGGGGSAWRRQP